MTSHETEQEHGITKKAADSLPPLHFKKFVAMAQGLASVLIETSPLATANLVSPATV